MKPLDPRPPANGPSGPTDTPAAERQVRRNPIGASGLILPWPDGPNLSVQSHARSDGFEDILPGPARHATSRRRGDHRALSQTYSVEDATRLVGRPLQRHDVEPVLRSAYGPLLDHPKLHVVSGVVDLDNIGAEHWNETNPLQAVVVCPPLGLHLDRFVHSPQTRLRGGQEKTSLEVRDALLRSHAELVGHYLRANVEVTMALSPQQATQAVYTTDPIVALGPLAIRCNPRHDERRLETLTFSSELSTETFGAQAPVEGGDLLTERRDGRFMIFQGLDSLRSNDASIEALGRLLHQRRNQLGRYEHVIVPLRQHQVPGQADGTLHLDYVIGYAGQHSQRVLLVAPNGLADPGTSIENLQARLRVADANVIEIHDDAAVIAGATNFVSLNPQEILFNDVEPLRPVHEELRRRGFTVHTVDLGLLSEYDGATRCASARWRRGA